MKIIAKKGEIVKSPKKPNPTEFENIVEDLDPEKSLLDTIEEELEGEGIVQFSNSTVDRDYLVLPPHLDEQDARDIGRYLHTFTQQRVWTRTLLAKVGVLLKEAREHLDKQRALIYITLPVKMSVTEKELSLYSNADACKALENVKAVSAKYDMLDSYMKNLEDIIFDVSREISRRGTDISGFNRAENIDVKRRA